MNAAPDPNAAQDARFLRHTMATLAYRAGKVLRDPPAGFAQKRLGPTTRTPLELVGHLGDLLEWAESLAAGKSNWKANSAGSWEADTERFFGGLARLDAHLAAGKPLAHPPQLIFQGPIADAFTHVGPIGMLRGHAGAAVKPESFARAEITLGRVGRDQSKTRKEFEGDASGKR